MVMLMTCPLHMWRKWKLSLHSHVYLVALKDLSGGEKKVYSMADSPKINDAWEKVSLKQYECLWI